MFSTKVIPILPLLAVYSLIQATGAVTAAEESKLLALLPDPDDPGTEVREKAELFSADNLYEYINGAAEAFIAYDFQQLVHQVYVVGETEVPVDIYDMGSEIDAFGIYSSERGRESKFLKVGTEGYWADGILNFVAGRYYVKLAAFAEEADTAALLLSFAERIERAIAAEPKLPKIFGLFPSASLVPHSQSYVKRAPLGHQFLSPGYLADYRFGNQVTTLLLSPSSDSVEAEGKLDQLRNHLEKSGQVTPLEKLGSTAFRAETKYEGEMVALRYEGFVVLLLGPPEHYGEFVRNLLAEFGSRTQN